MSLFIREVRRKRGMSQKELASLIGKSRGNVSRYELGQVNIPLRMLIAIARVLDVPIGALVDTNGDATKAR